MGRHIQRQLSSRHVLKAKTRKLSALRLSSLRSAMIQELASASARTRKPAHLQRRSLTQQRLQSWLRRHFSGLKMVLHTHWPSTVARTLYALRPSLSQSAQIQELASAFARTRRPVHLLQRSFLQKRLQSCSRRQSNGSKMARRTQVQLSSRQVLKTRKLSALRPSLLRSAMIQELASASTRTRKPAHPQRKSLIQQRLRNWP